MSVYLHKSLRISLLCAASVCFWASAARADSVTDWNRYTVEATKGFNGSTGSGVTLNSNLSARVEAIAGRAVFDAVNSVLAFSDSGYHYLQATSGDPQAAAAQAAHDVLFALLPNPAADPAADARWTQTRAWLDIRLAADLVALGVDASDGGIVAGHEAAAAAVAARSVDGAHSATLYGAALTPSTNPGIGLWRQNNGGPGVVNAVTGAPTGFDGDGVIQGRPAIDLHWRDVVPFSLSNRQRAALVAQVPLSPQVGSDEYELELRYVARRGRDRATSSQRSADQTAQALFYKQDAEIFIFEAARQASASRNLTLEDNARLFALLGNAIADARIAAWGSKYEQKYWRPITALNATADGSVTNNYSAWHPLAATPSHPSNTGGHSAAGAAGLQILRSFLASDRIRADGGAVTLGSLPWLVGTNAGTGVATTRQVASFSQIQLENGASRIYLGVHFGFDNLQGQLLGLAVADAIVSRSDDPAADGVRIRQSAVSQTHLVRTLLDRPDLYGYFGRATRVRSERED